MSGVTRVVGPVDPEAARWASGLNDPASGRLAIIVPPGLPSLAALVGELLGAMGKRADRNPLGGVAAETIELGLAWLAAHRIDRVVLIHADWLRADVVAELGPFAALAGVELACIVGDRDRDPLAPWATAEQAWFEFVAAETASATARLGLAADPGRHQLEEIGALGRPMGRVAVEPDEDPSGLALAAYIALVGRIRLDGRTEAAVANSLRLVLRTYSSAELPEAALGAAAALAQAGWRLWSDASATDEEPRPAWADLRTSVHPHQGAAVALIAAGLWVSELRSVVVSDVAADGSTVRYAGQALSVPPGARPYVVAQRWLAVDESAPFLTHRGRCLTTGAAESAVTAVMAEAGRVVDAAQLRRPATAGLRWLAARGLRLRRTEVSGEAVRMARRCRHGLAGEFEVDGTVIGHSQRLCRADGPADEVPWLVRPADGGFELTVLERSAQGTRIRVTRDGRPAGELVGLTLDQGLVWLQVGTGRAPTIERISDVIHGRYSVSTEPDRVR